MSNSDGVRADQRAAWAGLSAGWERWDAVIMAQMAPVTRAMVGSLGIGEDSHHLDVAAGTGEPGLTVARLAPLGHVVLADLSPEMLAVAGRRAAAQGISNVGTEVCSAEDLPFADATFHTATVRFGYMFLPDPAGATAELARVLRPRGRCCASVWVDPAANPWTGIVTDAIAAEVDLPPPTPDGPGMYRFAAPGAVGGLFHSAGLVEVAEWDVDVELVTTSAAEYWEMASEHISLAAAALRRVDRAARERIAATVVAAATDYERDGGVRVPGRARCTVGTRP